MLTEPKVDDRPARRYMGIRTQVPMQALPTVIPQLLDEVADWLQKQAVAPAGAPLIRYHLIDMEGNLDIELGEQVASAVPGEGRIAAGELPAGRYASLVYTGVANGLAANAALLSWGAQQGLAWDQWPTEQGDGFGARCEFFLNGPDDDPDPTTWKTEVAIRLAD